MQLDPRLAVVRLASDALGWALATGYTTLGEERPGKEMMP